MLAIDSTAHGRGPISRTKPRNHCLPGAELIVRIHPPPAASLQTLGSCRLSGTPLKQPLDNSGQIIAPARQSHAQHTHYPYSSPVTGEVRTSTDQFAVSAVQALEQTNMSCHDVQAQVIAHGLSSEAAVVLFDALPMIGRAYAATALSDMDELPQFGHLARCGQSMVIGCM